MDKKIRNQFNNEIFEEILSFWNLPKGETEELDGFESFIYSTRIGDKKAVLKISHTERRSIADLEGEIDFTQYLYSNNIRVPNIYKSNTGQTIHTVKAEKGMFTGVLYSFLEGSPANQENWNPLFWEKIGQLMGRLHNLSRNYSIGKGQRPTVFDEFGPAFDDNLDEKDTLIRRKVDSLYGMLKALPQNRDNWGMIHVDIHRGNFHINEGEIALFDFDDCQYSWYVHDIAMAFFYALPHNCDETGQIEKGHQFLKSFLTGYRREASIDSADIQKIPLFLKLRELELYALIKRSFDLNNLDPWCSSYMKNRKYRLENDIPYFPLDTDTVE